MSGADHRSHVEPDPAPCIKPAATSAVIALALCALAAHRQQLRDALALAGTPVATTVPLPTTFNVPRARPAGSAPRKASSAPPTDRAAPSPGGAPQDLEQLAVATFSEARPALLECLRAERLVRPGITGKLPVTVDVDDNGLVAHVALAPSPVRSEAFDECVTLSIAQLVFPTKLARRDLSITYALE